MNLLFLNAVKETGLLLELTAFRTKLFDQSEDLNPRQLKVLDRLIDYELKGGFDGAMSATMAILISRLPISTKCRPRV